MKNTVKLVENESGDWETLYLNNEVYAEGHYIPNHIWINLIHDLGHKARIEEVSNEI